MKKFMLFACLLLAVVTVNAQLFSIEQATIESAIKNKKPLTPKRTNFSNEGAGLAIELSDDATAAQIKALKEGLELSVEGVPAQTFLFEETTTGEKKFLLIDFKKVKLQTVKDGDAVILTTRGTAKTVIFKLINQKTENPVLMNSAGSGDPAVEAATAVFPKYFDQIKERVTINLYEKYKIPADFCCDTCKSCEDTIMTFNNRIIYDAISGLTYFIPYQFSNASYTNPSAFSARFCDTCTTRSLSRERFVVRNNHRIHLKSGDPLVYIIKNVNPYLYDVELTDTAFLVNNESNDLLGRLLFAKFDNADGISPHGAGLDKAMQEDSVEMERYLRVKTGLLHLRAEMGQLLENYHVMSRYAHNCIEEKKQLALPDINTFLDDIGKHPNQSFSSFIDIYLDPTSGDSSLNRNLKALYGEFLRSKYTIAYRFPEVPEADQVHFSLSIKRKADSPYPDLLNTRHVTQTAYVRNFLKIDVSTGLYYGSLQSNEFSTRPDSNVQVSPVLYGNRIVQEDIGKNEFGFASFLHFYYKFSYGFNIGLNVGAGFNFSDKPRPRYFSGASFMIGNNNRLVLNTGMMWGKVSELSSQYPTNPDGTYKLLPEGETNLVTKNKLKSGWFVSLTYNLPFLKRNKGNAEIKPPAESEKAADVSKAATGKQAEGDADAKEESGTQNLKMEKTIKRYQ